MKECRAVGGVTPLINSGAGWELSASSSGCFAHGESDTGKHWI